MQYRRIIINPTDEFFHAEPDIHPPRKNSYTLHIVLFLLTVLTTTGVGAVLANETNPFADITSFLAGLPFSITILSILGVHEFAHYFAARRWGIDVTLPYFIPAPILPIGTFGAVIKMRSSIPNRKALVDVGASGPIAGAIVAIAATIIGLKLSTIVPVDSFEQGAGFLLGESLLFKSLSAIFLGNIPDTQAVMLHPVAFAGWIGLFVTALNLLPIGQLDGGHILFALSPRYHDLVRRIRLPILILLGMTFWSGWYVWAALSLLFGKAHPYPDRMDRRLGTLRTGIAVTALILFILCIMPTPLRV